MLLIKWSEPLNQESRVMKDWNLMRM